MLADIRHGLTNAFEHVQVASLNWKLRCEMRKLPMIIAHQTDSFCIQWESSCPLVESELVLISKYQNGSRNSVIIPSVLAHSFDSSHYLYRSYFNISQDKDSKTQYSYYIKFQYDSDGQQQKRRTRVFDTRIRFHPDGYQMRIAFVSDNQYKATVFNKLLDSLTLLEYDYIVHVGDAVQSFNSLAEWEVDFVWPMTRGRNGNSGGLLSTTPLIYIPGNHDDYEEDGRDASTTNSGSQVTQSGGDNAPFHYFVTTRDRFKSLRIGHLHFTLIDSNHDSARQQDFVQSLVKQNEYKESQFRIALIHIPPYLEFWEHDAWFEKKESMWGQFVRDKYMPLMKENGLDIVISGHQHNYERTSKRVNGTYYFIIGGAGGELENTEKDGGRVNNFNMYDFKFFGHFYCMMDVYNGSILWRAIDSESRVVDSLTLGLNQIN
ncbi:hypothetical protein MP228_000625 [Amoeboaphelidium protococcarum]|nr:hypothetical protein MP228_000625 [Amoeboaphelidium protococcarum]